VTDSHGNHTAAIRRLAAQEEVMSLPDRHNPYSFEPFLEWRRNVRYYADDPFLQQVARHYCGEQWPDVDRAAREMDRRVSVRWRDLAEEASQPERRPYVQHFDAHARRIDRIVRPMETRLLEQEVFAEALFHPETPRWVRLMKMFLIYQNGEACVACPLVCTEGLVALLERFADSPATLRILDHCRNGVDGRFAVGAQYLSEIQGGSDVPANRLEAVPGEGDWRLYGSKFFCSATHADYAVVTAKPQGTESVALFVVPAWVPGEPRQRNGHTVDRLKWKMGTCELPTAEIAFQGARAYLLGPPERGLANVVSIVLTLSRLTVGLSAAASMTRAAREARAYAEFREAFGQPIARFPLLAGQLGRLEGRARRTTAGAFRLYREFLCLPDRLRGGLSDKEPATVRRRRFQVRELVMLQKITAAADCTDMLRLAMSVFGGHGVMEDFSALPRLYRDAAVNELWEGPRNVLLTQIHRDCQRTRESYPPRELVRDLLPGADPAAVADLGEEMDRLVSHPSLFAPDAVTLDISQAWEGFCHRLMHAYQDLALQAAERDPQP
jgi:alkylation response protein AidB-like acyl-CoA dehydrogenase